MHRQAPEAPDFGILKQLQPWRNPRKPRSPFHTAWPHSNLTTGACPQFPFAVFGSVSRHKAFKAASCLAFFCEPLTAIALADQGRVALGSRHEPSHPRLILRVQPSRLGGRNSSSLPAWLPGGSCLLARWPEDPKASSLSLRAARSRSCCSSCILALIAAKSSAQLVRCIRLLPFQAFCPFYG